MLPEKISREKAAACSKGRPWYFIHFTQNHLCSYKPARIKLMMITCHNLCASDELTLYPFDSHFLLDPSDFLDFSSWSMQPTLCG